MERKVVVTNLEQKESNLEKDKANELEQSSTANPDADLNAEATPSTEPSKKDGTDEVEVKDIDVKVEDAELVVETIIKKVKLEIKENV